MKTFLKQLLYFIPIPLIIMSVNYFEDPASFFNDDYVSGIANHLAQGYNVVNVSDCNERLLQKYFIEKMSICPAEIALGPSTAQLINSSYSTEKTFINNAVVWASLEDYLAILSLYEKKGCKIKKIMLGLGPWLLNDNNNLGRWRVLEDEYLLSLNKLFGHAASNNTEFSLHQYKRFKELLSFAYFKISLVSLFIDPVDKKYKPTKAAPEKEFTRLNDGSVYYGAHRLNASADEVEKRAKHDISELTYSLGNFTQLSEHYKLLFSGFIRHLQTQNIEVEFFLSPFHPLVYEHFRKNNYFHIIPETENYFRDYAANHKIKLFGSYDPAQFNFDNSYFIDGWHTTEKAMGIMLKAGRK